IWWAGSAPPVNPYRQSAAHRGVSRRGTTGGDFVFPRIQFAASSAPGESRSSPAGHAWTAPGAPRCSTMDLMIEEKFRRIQQCPHVVFDSGSTFESGIVEHAVHQPPFGRAGMAAERGEIQLLDHLARRPIRFGEPARTAAAMPNLLHDLW